MITICFTYFRSLTLLHLEAALYSLRQQDFSLVRSLVVLDNNTDDDPKAIQAVLDKFKFPAGVTLVSWKHKDPTKTHAWSTNSAVRLADTPWVFFTRADYLLNFDALAMLSCAAEGDMFLTGYGSHLQMDVAECNRHRSWREAGPSVLGGQQYDYTKIDTGVWLARKEAFDRVGGLDENLTAWGHAQTHFQWKLHNSGTQFKQVPEVLFYHMAHGGEKDLSLAHQQLAAQGINLQDLWARYEGPRIY